MNLYSLPEEGEWLVRLARYFLSLPSPPSLGGRNSKQHFSLGSSKVPGMRLPEPAQITARLALPSVALSSSTEHGEAVRL